MAFNLNKNDEAEKSSSPKKSGSSGFNLSKQEVKIEPSVTQHRSSSKTWIIGLVGVTVVGVGIWYYSSSRELASIQQSKASDSVAVAPANTEVADSTINVPSATALATENPNDKIDAQQNGSSSKASVVATLDRKIPVTFAQGSSSFVSMDQSLIKRLVAYLKDNPEASIQVNGYASSDGPLAINQQISQTRADAFKKFLISKNISENRIIALGKGIESPVASNESNFGRKKNRRIEVIFP